MSCERLRWLAWMGVCLAGTMIALALMLNLEIVDRRLTVSGPFQADPNSAGSRALIVDLRPALPLPRLFSSGGDSNKSPRASRLRAWVNDVPLDPPHAVHELIRKDGGGAFSHWDDHLIFSLPKGIANSEAVRLDVHFTLHLHPNALRTAYVIGFISLALLLRQSRRLNPAAFNRRLLRFLMVMGGVLRGLQLACILAAIVFLGSVAVGWWAGFALPNTAIFRWWPWLNGLALREPFFGHVLLVLAMMGAGISWLASSLGQHGATFADTEARMAAGFARYGLIFVIALFLYSVGATWAGIPRVQDLAGNAIAGLVPFSDAKGHFENVYFQAMEGQWHPFVARRPLAAAFRTVVVAAVDYNNYHFLMVQTVALAAATFFAAKAVAEWRGIWAGLTFLGLAYIQIRHYLPTNLTEPLGLFWALVAIPFFVRAIRNNRLRDAATSFHLTVWALLIRMGGMFTIPAVGLWVILSQWSSRDRIVRAIFAIIVIFAANAALIAGLSKLYGTEGGSTGSNFSHTICGLAHGTDWTGCGRLYENELRKLVSEAEQASFYYAKAKQKFLDEPEVLLGRLLEGERYFVTSVWGVLLSGYTGALPRLFPAAIWWLFAVAGAAWVLWTKRERHEASFWLLFFAGLAASAPFVMFDDGWRVLSASFPLLAVLVASGFTSPLLRSSVRQPAEASPVHWWPYPAIASVAVLCLVMPGLAFQRDWLDAQRIPRLDPQRNEEILLGTRRMAGFLVVPDGEELPLNVPAIHHAAFVEIVRNSGIEQYAALVTPSPIHQPPFAFVAAIPVNHRFSGLSILPAEVFSALHDRPWLVRYVPGNMWTQITEATPAVENHR